MSVLCRRTSNTFLFLQHKRVIYSGTVIVLSLHFNIQFAGFLQFIEGYFHFFKIYQLETLVHCRWTANAFNIQFTGFLFNLRLFSVLRPSFSSKYQCVVEILLFSFPSIRGFDPYWKRQRPFPLSLLSDTSLWFHHSLEAFSSYSKHTKSNCQNVVGEIPTRLFPSNIQVYSIMEVSALFCLHLSNFTGFILDVL